MFILYEGQEAPQPCLLTTSRVKLFEYMLGLEQVQHPFGAIERLDDGTSVSVRFGYYDTEGNFVTRGGAS